MDTQRGAAILAQIDRLDVHQGQVAIWALGQSGFVLKSGASVIYIDPYLTDAVGGRRFPPPIDPAQVRSATALLCTHEHLDHTDGGTVGAIMAASPHATMVTSPQGRQIALDADVAEARVVTPRLGERVSAGGAAVTAVPAAHPTFEVDAGGRSRWMGFLVEVGGVTVYHAGDTVIFPELLGALRGTAIDVAILPINGRDFYRERQEIVGNLWPGEAVELAKEIGARVLIACHNDLFAGNRVPPGLLLEELERRAPFLPCHMLQPGEVYMYVGG